MNTLSIARSPRTELAYTILAGLSLAARRRPTYLVWVVALVMAVFTGCSKDNPAGPADHVVRPGLYSSYIYKVTTPTISSNGSYTTYDTLKVTGVGLDIAGKNNVTEMTCFSSFRSPLSISYIKYEENGDVSTTESHGVLEAGDIATWVTHPIASRKATETMGDGNSSSNVPCRITSAYAGSSTISIANNTIYTDMVTMTKSVPDDGSVVTLDLSFARNLGYFSRINENNTTGRTRELVRYDINTKFGGRP